MTHLFFQLDYRPGSRGALLLLLILSTPHHSSAAPLLPTELPCHNRAVNVGKFRLTCAHVYACSCVHMWASTDPHAFLTLHLSRELVRLI